MKDIFAFIGIIVTFAACFMFFGMFIMFVIEKIRDLQRRYKYQHRFDKSPTAKCYCKDCIHYNDKDLCYYFKFNTDDDGFCWKADPKE